jgi:hypothetical protein
VDLRFQVFFARSTIRGELGSGDFKISDMVASGARMSVTQQISIRGEPGSGVNQWGTHVDIWLPQALDVNKLLTYRQMMQRLPTFEVTFFTNFNNLETVKCILLVDPQKRP